MDVEVHSGGAREKKKKNGACRDAPFSEFDREHLADH